MKKMKSVVALLLCSAMAMSVFGCAKTTKKTGSNGEEWDEEVESAVSEALKDTSEETEEDASAEETVADKEPDTVITFGDEGKYRYTVTIYGVDGVVTKYEGKTDLKEWEDLIDEMIEAGIFTYEIHPIMDEKGEMYMGSRGPYSVNGQDAGAGYYACYVNGVFEDDFGSTMNIIGAGDNDLVIRYTETNWLPSDTIYMPDPSVIFNMYIVSEKETWSYDYAGTAYKKVNGDYNYGFRHVLTADQSKTEGTFTDAYWEELLGIIEDLPDLEVLGKISGTELKEGQIAIFLNYNVCISTYDPEGKLVAFLNSYQTNPEITLR